MCGKVFKSQSYINYYINMLATRFFKAHRSWDNEIDLNGEAVPDDDDDGVPATALHVCIL